MLPSQNVSFGRTRGFVVTWLQNPDGQRSQPHVRSVKWYITCDSIAISTTSAWVPTADREVTGQTTWSRQQQHTS